MANSILLIAEAHEGKLKKATLSALAAAREIAVRTSGNVVGLIAGHGIDGAAKELAAHGVRVLAADSAAFAHVLAETYGQLAAEAAKKTEATYVVAAATSIGKDVMPRVAARLGAGVASDVIGLSGEGATVHFRRAMWAGNAIATVEVTTPVKCVTVRATEFAAASAATGGSVEAFSFTPSAAKTKFVEFVPVKSARPELTEARAVVSGGRGTKGDFTLIEQLADELGAAVGASRAVVDAGWQPNDLQVGQTGKVVAPQLYIAIGISGAIQHLAGMKGSKTIVAINKDADAPIFQVADYGLVADLFKVVPELVAEIHKAKV